MCLIEETGVKSPISVRAGGSWRLPTHPPPSQISGNSDFWGSKRNFGKANFYKSFHVSFRLSFSLGDIYFLFYGLSRRGKAILIHLRTVSAESNSEQHL